MNIARLSEILEAGSRETLARSWAETKAAEDFNPLPAGDYVAHVVSGELFTARQNKTPGYKLTFKVIVGEYAGRLLWNDLWLTGPALPMTKRDLGKLGVTSLDQLERPLPRGIRCQVKLALRREDDGAEYNRVRSFEVVGVDKPEVDAFAPADDAQGEQAAPDEGQPLPEESHDGTSV